MVVEARAEVVDLPVAAAPPHRIRARDTLHNPLPLPTLNTPIHPNLKIQINQEEDGLPDSGQVSRA